MNPGVDAYSASAAAWEAGPSRRVYDRLAAVVVDLSTVSIVNRVVLDLGAGTGAASRAISAAGGVPIAADAAFGMLSIDRKQRPPATQADAVALPFAPGSLGGVVAAFSLNHVTDPVRALNECARACTPGSPVLAATYASDDTHPAREAATAALEELGFVMAPWAVQLRSEVVPLMATADRCDEIARRAGLNATVHHLVVPFPELTARDLVEWRFGMAQHASFVASLAPTQRERAIERAMTLLDGAAPLTRSVLVVAATV